MIDIRNIRGALAIAESEALLQQDEIVKSSFNQIATMLNDFVKAHDKSYGAIGLYNRFEELVDALPDGEIVDLNKMKATLESEFPVHVNLMAVGDLFHIQHLNTKVAYRKGDNIKSVVTAMEN